MSEHFGLKINLIQKPQSDYLFVRGQKSIEIKTLMNDLLTNDNEWNVHYMKSLFVYVTHFHVDLSLKFDRKNEFRGQTSFVMYAYARDA